MKSFRKLLVFAVIAVMLIVSTSCGKSDTAEEAEKESVQVEESENKEAEKEVAAEKEATEEVNVVASEESTEESTEAETEGELSESDDEEVVELSLLNGTFYSTLIGLADYDLVDDPYINSVEIEDGYLVIQGSLKEIMEDDDMDDADDVDDDADDVDDDADDVDDDADDADDDADVDDQDDMDDESTEDAGLHEADVYRFKITDETEFYSAGGSLGAISITLDEFIELAHYYNGLGMVLEIEDGVLEEARITS